MRATGLPICFVATLLAINCSAITASAESVQATINVVNNSASTQTFFIYMPLSLSNPLTSGTLLSGSISATVADENGSGDATLSHAGQAIYRAYIDSSATPAAELWGAFTLDALSPAIEASDNISFSDAAGSAALAQIALEIRFNLSPGDSASVTGVFEVEDPALQEKSPIGPTDVDDLLAVMRNWGACPDFVTPCEGDYNSDFAVDIEDLMIVLAEWG